MLLAVLAVLAVVALVVTGRGSGLPEAQPDRAPRGVLPDGPVSAADVDALRFSLGFRGYRMDEVDAVLDRLRGELAERDARIAGLEAPDGAAPDGAALGGDPHRPGGEG